MIKKRVVIAMSGGVDSSVAAALLQGRGYEVIGITMCFSLPDSKARRPSCCGLQAIEDARRVTHKLNIRHYVLNMQKDLQEYVINNFCQQYLEARTPNPCIRCNQYLKFGILLKKALSLEANFLATGHYARIERTQGHKDTRTQVYMLKKGIDRAKDQSYFLYRLNQSQLKHVLFPLGGYTKVEVRRLAKGFGLSVADKLGSQEICFLAGRDYRDFLRDQVKDKIKPGLVVDKEGNVLGEHKGLAYYTIGQREGLGIAKGYPLYIIGLDRKLNQITLGAKEDACSSRFLVRNPHFVARPIKKKVVFKVKIRYNHQESPAEVTSSAEKIHVCFRKPQFAITPGQSAVFYDKDRVVGGGIIEKVLG